MEAGETPQRVKAPASKPDDMTLISKTHMMEGENSHKLSSDLYMCTRVHTYIQMHLLCAGRHTHACTHVVNFYSIRMQLLHVGLIYFSKIILCL